MVTLALIYVVIYTTQVLWISMPTPVEFVLGIASIVIWLVFIVDLTTRTYLAPRRWHYLAQHPLDVLAVIVPAFRALRVLRVFTAGQWLLSRGKHVAVGRTFAAIAIGAAAIWFFSALAFYDAERGVAETNIDSFGDALWWAIVTMSTVGYGDVYPTTVNGRFVAAATMVIGISLLGIVTATMASWFLSQTRRQEQTAGREVRRAVRRQPERIPAPRRVRQRRRS